MSISDKSAEYTYRAVMLMDIAALEARCHEMRKILSTKPGQSDFTQLSVAEWQQGLYHIVKLRSLLRELSELMRDAHNVSLRSASKIQG